MEECVFDQRLQKKRWYKHRPRGLIDENLGGQAAPKPHLLDGEIVLDKSYLLLQGNQCIFGAGEHVAKDAGQHGGHALGEFGRGDGQMGNGVERVEQEVGLHLGPQRAQLGFSKLRAQPFFVLFTLAADAGEPGSFEPGFQLPYDAAQELKFAAQNRSLDRIPGDGQCVDRFSVNAQREQQLRRRLCQGTKRVAGLGKNRLLRMCGKGVCLGRTAA